MNQQLTEKILASVMDWDTQSVAENIRDLEHFAELKYDQYQQYQVGSRFVENLTLWLNKFENIEERKIAFDFVKNAIVFVSQEELYHLINSIYPDLMRPLFKAAVNEIGKNNHIEDKDVKEKILDIICRQSLIFGLSDGARLDVFRRGAPVISNEQVCISYEIKDERMDSIKEEIEKDTIKFYEKYSWKGLSKDKIFNIFLLDDFSGSGISYLRTEQKEGETIWKGKIIKVIDQLKKQLDDFAEIAIHVVLYLATKKAKEHIEEFARIYAGETGIHIQIHILQYIHPIRPDAELEALMKKYYNPSIEDSHYKKGKHDNPFLGFDECSLPVVIYHNTPNNSFPIIWAPEHALFPRVTRHKDIG